MSLLSANLQAFIAITRTQTVQGAAKELGITQTGVTQRIRALEGQLSTTLFTRSRRGMMLTHEGQALLRYCQAARDLEGETLSKIQKSGLQSEVRVCITGPTSIVSSRIIYQVSPVIAKFPEMLLSFKVSDLENRVEDLKQGVAQFAVVSHAHVAREMDSKVLKSEKYILVGTSKWRRRTLKEIVQKERIIDFDVTDRTTHQYLRRFKLDKLMRPERHFINDNEALIQLFKAGAGYGVLTSEVAAQYLESGILIALNGGATLENPMALAWYPRPEMPGYFRAMMEAIK